MPAWKALFMLLVVAAIVGLVVFYFVPSARPAFVKRWFWAGQGLKAASTPRETLDKFQEAIKNRKYEAAVELYLGGPYKEELRLVAEKAEEYGQSVDNLMYNLKEVAKISSPRSEFTLGWIDPFPKEMKVEDFTAEDEKNPDLATARVTVVEHVPTGSSPGDTTLPTGWTFDRRIHWSLVPKSADTDRTGGDVTLNVHIKNEGTKDKPVWKIHFVSIDNNEDPAFRDKIAFFKDKALNYARVLDSLGQNVKIDATYKERAGFEEGLRKGLVDETK
jgi:hypothetical protein